MVPRTCCAISQKPSFTSVRPIFILSLHTNRTKTDIYVSSSCWTVARTERKITLNAAVDYGQSRLHQVLTGAGLPVVLLLHIQGNETPNHRLTKEVDR